MTSIIALINLSDNSPNILDVFPNAIQLESSKYLIKIECKYYTADIHLQTQCDIQDILGKEAVVIYFTDVKASTLANVLSCMKKVASQDIPLRLLVCSTFDDEAVVELEASEDPINFRQSMLKYEFELIELEPSEDSVDEDDEFGVQRIKSALEAHMWPNMVMIDNQSNRGVKKTNQKKSCSAPADQLTRQTVPEAEENKESSSSSSEDNDLETLECMFQNLMQTRQKIAKLDPKARHKMAEKMTIQFWRAIGGSEDEIDGLHSTSDSESENSDEPAPPTPSVEHDKTKTN